MEHTKLTELLNKVAQGEVSVEKAALELKTEPFEDLGFAKLDHHRKIRQGAAAVSYTHLTLPTTCNLCRSRWSPYH